MQINYSKYFDFLISGLKAGINFGHHSDFRPVFAVLILPLCIMSCSSEPGTSYFPLQEGLQWRYKVTQTTRDGVRQQKYIYTNLAQRTIEGQLLSVRRSVDGTLFYYHETADGVVYAGKEMQTGIRREYVRDERFILHYPLQLGDKWQDDTTTKLLVKTGPPQKTVFKVVAEIPLDVSLAALDETIIVPAGVFRHCIKINKHGSEFKDAGNYIGRTIVRVKESSWYAPGVGLVKSVREETTESQGLDRGELIVELELFES